MTDTKVYRCKLHDHPYTVCPLCGCQYCERYWPVCPRSGWHVAHLEPARVEAQRRALQPTEVTAIVHAPSLRSAIVHLLEVYTPQAIVAELKGAINDQAERQESTDSRQRLRNLAALLPQTFEVGS